MTMQAKKYLFIAVMMMLVIGCKQSQTNKQLVASELPIVFVSNYPLHYFTQSVAGDKVEIYFPAATSGDPAYWSPTPEDVAEIQAADIVILNGASYEKWAETVSLPTSKVVSTTADAYDALISLEGNVTHSHGPEGDHAHGGTAFTTWLDFSLAAKQAESVYQILSEKYPENQEEFKKNYLELEKQLLQLDAELLKITSGNTDLEMVFSHPVYQYLQRRYKIHGHSVHWEPDAEISKAMWHDLEHALHGHKVDYMVWEGEPLGASVEKLKNAEIASLVFDPCSNLPEEGDFLSVMQSNIEALKEIY
jgi:zinc transport system substrate-binding protein